MSVGVVLLIVGAGWLAAAIGLGVITGRAIRRIELTSRAMETHNNIEFDFPTQKNVPDEPPTRPGRTSTP